MQSFSSFIFQLLTYFNAASKKFKNVDVIDNEIWSNSQIYSKIQMVFGANKKPY